MISVPARLRFTPQAWINDYATTVDPAGNSSWLDDIPPGISGGTYEADDLRNSTRAPDWVRGWQGPFEIDVEYLEDQTNG